MTLSAIIITVASYLALLFAVAWMSSKRADNQTFFTGNRRSPWWIVAWGMIGASMSGVTFVSVPGMVGWAEFSYLQMSLGFVCGYVVIALVIIPLHYRLGNISIYEYLQGRFGVGSYRTGAWMFFVSKMLGAAVRIYLVCLVLQLLVFQPIGVPFAVGAGIVMLLVWLYTFRGGVRSIVWTDSLRTFFLVAGVGLSIWFISKELGLPRFDELTAAIKGSDLSRVWFFDDPSDGRWFFKQFFAGLLIVVAMTGLDQDMMQLPLSCRRRQDASRNFIISGALQFIVITMLLSLGALLYIFAGERGITATGDEIFPSVAIFGGLPVVVGVVFILGLISSTFSAAGSALTALTTSFTVDILGRSSSPDNEQLDAGGGPNEASRVSAIRLGRRRADGLLQSPNSEMHLTRTRRVVHACLAAAMVGVILVFRALGSTSVIDAVYTLASYTYGPLLGMFAFGILTRRGVRDRWAPLVGIAAPALCLVLDLNSAAWFGGYVFSYEILILNAGFTFAGLWALSVRSKNRLENELKIHSKTI